jgi:hypothetical protein
MYKYAYNKRLMMAKQLNVRQHLIFTPMVRSDLHFLFQQLLS